MPKKWFENFELVAMNRKEEIMVPKGWQTLVKVNHLSPSADESRPS